MDTYYSDGRRRYGIGESYDWFYKYENYDGEPQIYISSNGLWTYGFAVPNVPSVIDGKNVVSLDSTFDGFYELKSVVVPEGVTNVIGAFYGCET